MSRSLYLGKNVPFFKPSRPTFKVLESLKELVDFDIASADG